MVDESITKKVLEYLKKEGSTNTFKMARTMSLERNQLLTLIGRLEKKEAVKYERGKVIFIKFPAVEKPVKVVSSLLKQKNIEKAATGKPAQPKALLLLQAENKQLQRKVLQLGESMKELERKASAAPKKITKTIIRTIIKKVPVTKTIIKKVPVTKTVVKEVPVTKTVVRRIQASPPVPSSPAESKVWEKLKAHSEQFKVSGSKLFEDMKQLKEPEFVRW